MIRARTTIALLALAAASIAAPGVGGAQQAAPQHIPIPGYLPPATTTAPLVGFGNYDRWTPLQSVLVAETQTRLAMDYGPGRVRLANQVGYLIDQGDCAGAASLAWFRHDNAIAAAVPAACKTHRRQPKS